MTNTTQITLANGITTSAARALDELIHSWGYRITSITPAVCRNYGMTEVDAWAFVEYRRQVAAQLEVFAA